MSGRETWRDLNALPASARTPSKLLRVAWILLKYAVARDVQRVAGWVARKRRGR